MENYSHKLFFLWECAIFCGNVFAFNSHKHSHK